MLITNRQVTASQIEQLDKLSSRCQQNDKGLPAFYRHILLQKRDTDSNVFYYQNGVLVGFLSAYFFYSNACEVSMLVDPSLRRHGISIQLLKAIFQLFISKQLDTVIFSTPSTLHDHWLPKLGFSYQQTEYHMLRVGYDPILITQPALSIRKAEHQDIETLCAMDDACFKDGQISTPSRFISLLSDNNYSLFVAMREGVPVGKAHIRWQDQNALFSDIAILPPFQRQGLGSELLSFCINHALTSGKSHLELDVETSNRNALDLYLRHNFKIAYEHDFWYISLVKLQKMLETSRHQQDKK